MPLATLWPHLVTGAGRRCAAASDEQPSAPVEDAWPLAEQLDEPLRRLAGARRARRADVDDRATRTRGSPRTPSRRLPVLGGAARRGLGGRRPGASGCAGSACRSTSAARRGRRAVPARPRRPAPPRPRRGGTWPATRSPRRWPGPTRPTPAHRVRGGRAARPARRGRHRRPAPGRAAPGGRRHRAAAPARASTRANPAGLTNRQLDVARLVARGFTNAEIAAAALHLAQDRRPPRLGRPGQARPAQPAGRRRPGRRARALLTGRPAQGSTGAPGEWGRRPSGGGEGQYTLTP